jgi:phage antirepressor YoqD-like protein
VVSSLAKPAKLGQPLLYRRRKKRQGWTGARPKARPGQPPKEKEIIGTAEVAKRLKIDPKQFRKILRSQASKANGGARYEFTESDAPKLRKLVEAAQQENAAKKSA